MTESKRERELKLEVPADFELPDLSQVAPSTTVERSTIALSSTYFDTVELSLLAHAVTLRRREGDEDTGWHLKVPAGKARNEIRLPLDGADTPPDQLTDLLAGIIRPGTLVEVATLQTERRLTRVRREGRLVVEIADDRVVASSHGGRTDDWRELEIELGDAGDEKTLAAFSDALVAAGATGSTHTSKLARALGRSRPERRRRPAADRLIADYVHAQFRWLVAGDIALRRGQDDLIRRTRVSVRRIRGVLRVFVTVLDANAARALDAELSWYAGLLGDVRDRQVQRARVADAVAALPLEAVLGPVAARLERTLSAEQDAAFEALGAALHTNRYRRLLGSLAAFADGVTVVDGTTTSELRRCARTAAHKAATRLQHGVGTDATDDVAVHRARTAVARARYAAELLAEGNTTATIKAYTTVQDVLGAHQDAVVSAGMLLRVAASLPDENGFTYGVLYERELDVIGRLRSQAARLIVPI